MRRGRRARFAARAVKTIAIVAIAIDAVARAVASADDVDADAPLLSFGHYVKGETAASLIDPDVRAAAAIENELIIPGSVWAQALDEAARVQELARMLGGREITDPVLANARELLARAAG